MKTIIANEVEIRIPAVGMRQGTVGWLSAGLAEGSITIKPGVTSKDKKPGLWINYPDASRCLALFNPWDMQNRKYLQFEPFTQFDEDNSFGVDQNLTDAAVGKLEKIAREWCAEMNALRESDAE